ncbi:helix-turn-helix domain-containing protein [Pseudomonas sp. ODNR1LW]|nr:helix-turn-helix domain-containing protein [Pseudomonas sp. ODNR1LW]
MIANFTEVAIDVTRAIRREAYRWDGMDPLEKRFGKLVAAHRRRSSLTQAQLAERAGVSVDMIAKLEIGAASPSFRTVDAVANALEVDVAELFTTQLPSGKFQRPILRMITDRLAVLTDAQLEWVSEILEAALKGGRRT